MSEPETIANFVTLSRLGLVTVLLWLATRAWELWRADRQRHHDRQAFLRALFAEVEFNTQDMTRFLEAAPPLVSFEPLFRQPDYVPHVTDARHTEVYRSRVQELHFLDDGLIADLVRFYGDLEKVRSQIEGLQFASFIKISPQGKLGTIANLYRTCGSCELLGNQILGKMELRYEAQGLKRRPNDTGASSTVS